MCSPTAVCVSVPLITGGSAAAMCACVCVCVAYLDVLDQELGRRFHRRFGVDDLLDGTRPVHSFVEVLGVQPVAVLPPVHRDAPVA